ncbi:MAG: helix-hairpin-helix domain-containing protein, partial [Candidatus Thorarchaeota archaeon]
LIYSFYKNLLPVGKWNLTVICSKTNYQAAIGTLSDMIEVSSAPTDLDLSNGYTSTVTVDWRETAVFEVNFTRTSDGAGLTGASHFENWTDVISLDAQGSGRYLVELDTNLPATTYTLNLTMWLDNHLSSEISLTVTILVPLVIEGDYIQGEEPMDVYWTHEFDLDFALKDQSRGGDPVQSAILTYDWYRDGVIDQQGTLNEYSGGIYNDTLNAYDAEPSSDSYGILITAEKAGCTTAQVTLHVRINEVPNEVVVRQDYFEQYYGDNITVYFYWNNTLDNQPIEYPDSAWIEIWGRGSNITNGMNYHNGTFSFEVHTKAMKMYPDDDSGFKLYTFKLEMNAMGYAEHSTPSLAVLVLETPTRMDVADLSAVEWDDPLTITVNLTDSVHDELIWNEAVVELVYGDIRRPMESYFNGTFYVTIETEDYFSGQDEPYDLSIEYSLPNYEDGEINLEVTVEPRRAEIDIIPESLKDQVYEGDWSDIVDISFLVSRVDQTGIKVRYATASYSWVEYPSITGPFSFNNDTDIYGLSLNTTEVPAGVRTLRITVTRENYTISPFDIQMTLNPLTADLSTDITSLSKIHTVETTAGLSFTLTYGDEVLDAATVRFEWGGVQRTASFVNGEYIFEFNPSVEGIEVPKTYLLNFTTDIQNYTVDTVSIPLTMLAPTELTGPAVYLEEDQSGTAYFRYWDTYNDRPVADDDDASPSINVYFPGDDDSIQPEFNGTHYYFSLEAADLGEAQTDPYEILLTATAGSYQNHTTTSGEDAVTLNVYVSPPTYNIPLIGRVQRSLVNLALIMFGLFVLVVGSAVGVKRWRRPHAIKQIESAISDMEENKTAKVKDIKSMGMVVSELLAPGLAELDMKAPTIDTGPEVEFEAGLGEEAEDLLGELDALDEISKEEPAAVEESTDYEAQIEAELEAMDEEEMQVSDIPGIGPTIEDRLANAEYTTVSALSEADPLVLAEIEGISENKAEQIVDEARAMVSEPVEEDIESEAEEEERPPEEDVEEILPEDEAEAALTEEDMEDELPEGESEDILSEESELSDDEATAEKDEPEVEKPKTKRELIEQLPDEIKETMGDDEIRKLSKRELEALIEDQEYSEK